MHFAKVPKYDAYRVFKISHIIEVTYMAPMFSGLSVGLRTIHSNSPWCRPKVAREL